VEVAFYFKMVLFPKEKFTPGGVTVVFSVNMLSLTIFFLKINMTPTTTLRPIPEFVPSAPRIYTTYM